ncbi:hypothetical protein LTR10_008859 [Elasticomyces elasticus]|nr:hypothetical protein LTR10_008859 [Elasticomyces elasticus]KAK4974170.1 hypothetical protein LTR42_004809 [Elasticomyces elasticus]
MATDLVERLTAKGPGESAGFLNDIIAHLWPNICVAGGKMTADIANPMFKTMLPGPLSSLHFTKVDFGKVPMRVSSVIATKTDANGIKLDLTVEWKSKSDIELDANMMPALIGAVQVAFINPPVLKLDFTGAANVADFSAIDGAVRNVILTVINGILVLPNRILVNLDTNNDYFATFMYPLGILRVNVDRAWGFAEESKGKASRIFSKITRSAPDSYAKLSVGAEEPWKTKTKNNTTHPIWAETHDFIVTDLDQCLKVDVEDEDVGGDDEVGIALTTVREAMNGAKQELSLIRKGVETEGRVSISSQFFPFAPAGDSFSAADHKGEGRLCGLATILIGGAYGIRGAREELKPSVKVTWGEKHSYQTAIKTDSPGMDMNNPAFDQNFRIPLTSDLVGSGVFRIALLNGEKETGAVEIPFADVLSAPEMTLQNKFDMGGGATVRASICLRGVKAA